MVGFICLYRVFARRHRGVSKQQMTVVDYLTIFVDSAVMLFIGWVVS